MGLSRSSQEIVQVHQDTVGQSMAILGICAILEWVLFKDGVYSREVFIT